MPGPQLARGRYTGQVSQIKAGERNLEAEAAEYAAMRKELAMRRNARNYVADKLTADVFIKRRRTLVTSDFDLTVNTLNVDSLILKLKSPGVQNGLQLAFAGVKESFGYQYLALRAFGQIRDLTPAVINRDRFVVRVDSAMGVEKVRLLDISPQAFNESSARNQDTLLSYQIAETYRAKQGEFITGFFLSPTALVAANCTFNFETLALEAGD